MTTLREAAQQALEALDYCIEHSAEIVAERAKDRGQGSDDLQMMMVEYLEKHRCVITTLRAALAQQAEPLTIERLRAALVASRVIPPEAVEDPDNYDDGVMLGRIEALYRRIA